MNTLQNSERRGARLQSFKARMVTLFIVMLTVAVVSQFFYKTSIDALHSSLLSAVHTADVIHAAENFHSATHSMLFIATNGNRLGSVKMAQEYREQKALALKMLSELSDVTGAKHNEKHDSGNRALVDDLIRSFSDFSLKTDALTDQTVKWSENDESSARKLFDSIFSSYLVLLHQYHDTRLEDLKNEAHSINRRATVMFIVQLGIVIIAGVLVLLFSFHNVVRPYQKAERYALSDALTGLRNRRYLDAFAIPEMSDLVRKGIPFSLGLMDVDKFKTFNDTYGHQAGDEILKGLATLVNDGIRESDFVVRYGGEEFLVFLPGAKKESAIHVIEKIRSSIEKNPFNLPDNDLPVSVTASFGMASFPEDGEEAHLLIKIADERLYQAKKSGRNQICV